jgi:hypothetical protein
MEIVKGDKGKNRSQGYKSNGAAQIAQPIFSKKIGTASRQDLPNPFT